jgi:hypothetical protein
MSFEDSIAVLAADISDTFAEEVRRSIGKIILEEKHFASCELENSTVCAAIQLFACNDLHAQAGCF